MGDKNSCSSKAYRTASMESRKPKKVHDHLEVKAGDKGGHAVSEHFTSYEHKPEMTLFGKGQEHEALAHLGEKMGVGKKGDILAALNGLKEQAPGKEAKGQEKDKAEEEDADDDA